MNENCQLSYEASGSYQSGAKYEFIGNSFFRRQRFCSFKYVAENRVQEWEAEHRNEVRTAYHELLSESGNWKWD